MVSADTGEPVPAAQISANASQIFLNIFAPRPRSGWTDTDGYWHGEVPRYRLTSIYIDAAGHMSARSGADWTGSPPDLVFHTYGDHRATTLIVPSFHADGRPIYVVPLQSTTRPETIVVFPKDFRGFVLVSNEPGPALEDRSRPWAFTRHVAPGGTVDVPVWPQPSALRAMWSTGEEFPGFNTTHGGRVCVYEIVENESEGLYIVGKSDDWHRAHRLVWLPPLQPGGPSRFDGGALDLLRAEILRRDTPLAIEDAERLIRRAKLERGLPMTDAISPALPPCVP